LTVEWVPSVGFGDGHQITDAANMENQWWSTYEHMVKGRHMGKDMKETEDSKTN
jgi:hypothetical protein